MSSKDEDIVGEQYEDSIIETPERKRIRKLNKKGLELYEKTKDAWVKKLAKTWTRVETFFSQQRSSRLTSLPLKLTSDQYKKSRLEASTVRSQVSRLSRKSGSNISQRTHAKAEAARAKVLFAEEEIKIKKEHARLKEEEAKSARRRSYLEADLTLLEHKKEAAAAEAELEALASSAGSSQKSRSHASVNAEERTRQYVADQRSIHESTKLNVQVELTTNVNETKKDQDEVQALSVELLNHYNKENERTPNSNKVQQNVSISQPADRPLNIYAPIFQPEVRQSQENQNINQFTREACLGKVHAPDIVNVNKTYLQRDGRASIFKPCPNNLDVREKYRTEDDMDLSQPNQHDYDKGSIFERTINDDKVVPPHYSYLHYVEAMSPDTYILQTFWNSDTATMVVLLLYTHYKEIEKIVHLNR
ncbi:unnamed protein product [Mytilus coruscus]|uniref:Uncharacterized protein n=1 Tax=Mytilus coruscus TaxID=42192 RepID=A0A6J8B6V2_MYTCO|nr:unnamed protein product [Mytilus coruscus]